MNAKKISCIICAFNEEKRISTVLNAVKNHPYLDEVIVIDDGSTDKTKDIVKQFDFVKLIVQEKNGGKSKAMAKGIEESKNDILIFLGADLLHIKADDITDLVRPIIEDSADMSISVRKNSLWIYKKIGLDFVSGERVIYKKFLIDKIEDIKKLPGFGIEVFMNRIIIKNKLRIAIIKWKNVISERKSNKMGFWKGTFGDIKMINEILKVISFKEIILQNYRILKLAKKI